MGDMDSFTESWRQGHINDVKYVAGGILDKCLQSLTDTWDQVYPQSDSTSWKIRYNRILEEYEKRVMALYEEEEEKKLKLVKEIEEKFLELFQLEKELNVTIQHGLRDSNDPLTVMSSKLDDVLKAYREERITRVEKLQALRQKESQLCELLEAQPLAGIPAVPTDDQFANLDRYIVSLLNEKDLRSTEYSTVRAHVHNMMQTLEETPTTAFEKKVFNSSPFPLTPQYMSKLKALEEEYNKKLEEATSHANLLLSVLEKLWARIKEPEENKTVFKETHRGVGKSTITALNEEIKRAEKIKMDNMKPVIEGMKEEIVILWDKLTYTDEQKRQFAPFHSDYISEDVMELHEIELTRLQTQLDECRRILDLAEQRDELLARRTHLEELSKDKSRLFNNRGGQLLREEKERKALVKKCPKIDADLIELLLAYEEEHGKPFLFHGENLLDKIKREHVETESKKMTKSTSVHSLGKRAHPSEHGVSSVNSSRVITRSQTPRSDISTGSCASYSHFQSNLGEPTFATPKRMALAPKTPSKIARTPVRVTPGRANARTPLRPIQTQKPSSSYRATSSPRGTPGKRTMIPAPLSASRTPHRAFY